MSAVATFLDQQALTLIRDPWSIRNVVTRLVQSDRLGKSLAVDDRRAFARKAVKVRLWATPCAVQEDEVILPPDRIGTIQGVSKDLSFGGVGFVHVEEFPAQFGVFTFELPDGGFESLVAEMRWSQRQEEGGLLSGSQFIGVTETPWFLK